MLAVRRILPALAIVLLLVASSRLRAETSADAEQAIVELYKTGKL
jgi:hypothetical protein